MQESAEKKEVYPKLTTNIVGLSVPWSKQGFVVFCLLWFHQDNEMIAKENTILYPGLDTTFDMKSNV